MNCDGATLFCPGCCVPERCVPCGREERDGCVNKGVNGGLFCGL